jgi:hypothetical protein
LPARTRAAEIAIICRLLPRLLHISATHGTPLEPHLQPAQRAVSLSRRAAAFVLGDALEELGIYLLSKISGVKFLRRNILDAARAHELDLAFWNDQRISLLHFLDAVLISECKASAGAVGSDEVGWFVRKLQARGASHGILIALNGITWVGEQSAHSEVLAALLRDRIKILLLTRAEILELTTTTELANLLKEKEMQLTLDRVVHFARE